MHWDTSLFTLTNCHQAWSVNLSTKYSPFTLQPRDDRFVVPLTFCPQPLSPVCHSFIIRTSSGWLFISSCPCCSFSLQLSTICSSVSPDCDPGTPHSPPAIAPQEHWPAQWVFKSIPLCLPDPPGISLSYHCSYFRLVPKSFQYHLCGLCIPSFSHTFLLCIDWWGTEAALGGLF